jgi:hypothetical protein
MPIKKVSVFKAADEIPNLLLANHRAICALLVREKPIPDELRVYEHLSLYKLARLIRRDMTVQGAADARVEEFVAQHVHGD